MIRLNTTQSSSVEFKFTIANIFDKQILLKKLGLIQVYWTSSVAVVPSLADKDLDSTGVGTPDDR